MRAEVYGKIGVTLLLLVAVARAATASPPKDGQPATDALAKDAYGEVISRERAMRHEAALKFPGDPWSADDDYHDREQGQARAFASSHDTRLSDVLRAVDDGMHARWPAPAAPDPKAPPCRPRLAY